MRWDGIDLPTAAHAAARVGYPIVSHPAADCDPIGRFLSVSLETERRQTDATERPVIGDRANRSGERVSGERVGQARALWHANGQRTAATVDRCICADAIRGDAARADNKRMHGIDAMGYGANDTRARRTRNAWPVNQSGPVAMGTTAGAMVGGPRWGAVPPWRC
jgi:hypothetical protein